MVGSVTGLCDSASGIDEQLDNDTSRIATKQYLIAPSMVNRYIKNPPHSLFSP
jgi:hypothetical protein